MTESSFPQHPISIVGIQTVKGSITVPEDSTDLEIESLDFSFKTTIAYNAAEDIVKLALTINVMGLGKQDRVLDISASYTNEFLYQVVGLKSLLEGKEDRPFPQALATQLVNVAYGTSRGIIFTRTQGTVFTNGIVLPVVYPASLVQPGFSPAHLENPEIKKKRQRKTTRKQ